MQLPMTKMVWNRLTNWTGGLTGIPTIIKGLGVSNLTEVAVEHGHQYSFFFSFQDFDITLIAIGIGMLVLGYGSGKEGK